MTNDTRTLGFGITFDTVAAQTACGQLLSLTSHRGDDENPPHRHVNDYICMVLSGSFAELQKNRSFERRAGFFFAHEAGHAHHDHFGPKGAICLNLHFPPGVTRPRSIEGHCSPWARITADKLAFALAASSRDELSVAALAAEIMVEIHLIEAERGHCGRWIGRIIEAISDEPRRRWSLRELADIAQRHPVRMAQAFRARTGMSLGAFQRLRRLTSLSLALRRKEDPLAVLAAEFGYFDQSHMTSEFRGAFGMSPGRYRLDYR